MKFGGESQQREPGNCITFVAPQYSLLNKRVAEPALFEVRSGVKSPAAGVPRTSKCGICRVLLQALGVHDERSESVIYQNDAVHIAFAVIGRPRPPLAGVGSDSNRER